MRAHDWQRESTELRGIQVSAVYRCAACPAVVRVMGALGCDWRAAIPDDCEALAEREPANEG